MICRCRAMSFGMKCLCAATIKRKRKQRSAKVSRQSQRPCVPSVAGASSTPGRGLPSTHDEALVTPAQRELDRGCPSMMSPFGRFFVILSEHHV
jgi:hypothetical protein